MWQPCEPAVLCVWIWWGVRSQGPARQRQLATWSCLEGQIQPTDPRLSHAGEAGMWSWACCLTEMERMCPSGPWNEPLEAESPSHICCAFLRVAEGSQKLSKMGQKVKKKRNYFHSWRKAEKVRERPLMGLYFCCQWSQDEGRFLIHTRLVSTTGYSRVDRFPPGGLDSVKAAFSHGKYFLLEHFWLTFGMNVKGSDSNATVTSSIKSTEALEGWEGAEGAAPTSPWWCWTWAALSAVLATPKTLQWWKPWGLASSVALGWVVMAWSAHTGLAPRGQAGHIMAFSHILIRLMEWPEMLMGLELSRMTKHSGFALLPIPAAHQRGMAAPDLQAVRTTHQGGAFPPRHGSNPNTSHSLQPELGLTFFWLCPMPCAWSQALGRHCGGPRGIVGPVGVQLRFPWGDLPAGSAVGTLFLSMDQMTTEVIALGAGQLRGDYGLGSVAGVNHPVLTGSSGERWICTSYEFHSLHLNRLLFSFSPHEKRKIKVNLFYASWLLCLQERCL